MSIKEAESVIQSVIQSLQELKAVRNFGFSGDLEHIRERIRDHTFKLAVVGEFSSGKSTFINSVIGRDLLSHAVDETTAAITYIYNVDESDERCGTCRIRFTDGREEVLADYACLSEYSTTKSSISVVDVIQSISIYIHFLSVDVPVVIVDTPGLNGVADKHKDMTIEEVKKAHACIYLMSVRGLTESDISFIKVLSSYQSFFIFVQNFIDALKASEGETPEKKIRKAEEIIRSELSGCGTMQYQICAISALQALAAKDPGIKKLYEQDTQLLTEERRAQLLPESGYPVFEQLLTGHISSGKYKQTMLDSAAANLEFMITSMLEILQDQKAENEELMKTDFRQHAVYKAAQRLEKLEEKCAGNWKKLENFIVSKDKENRKQIKAGLRRELEETDRWIAGQIDERICRFEDFDRIESKTGKNVGEYFSDMASERINTQIMPKLNRDIQTAFQVLYSDALLRAARYAGQAPKVPEALKLGGVITDSTDATKMHVEDRLRELETKKKEVRQLYQAKEAVNREKSTESREYQKQQKLILDEEQAYEKQREELERKRIELGSRPSIREYTEKRTKKVKREGFFGSIGNFFLGEKEETYFVTVQDDSARKKWNKKNEEINTKLFSAQKEHYAQMELLTARRDEFETKMRSSQLELERLGGRIRNLEHAILAKEEEYQKYMTNAKKEFCDVQKSGLKKSFHEKLLEDGQSACMLDNLEDYTDHISQVRLPELIEKVMKNFEASIDCQKKMLTAVIQQNTGRLEQEYLALGREAEVLQELEQRLQICKAEDSRSKEVI